MARASRGSRSSSVIRVALLISAVVVTAGILAFVLIDRPIKVEAPSVLPQSSTSLTPPPTTPPPTTQPTVAAPPAPVPAVKGLENFRDASTSTHAINGSILLRSAELADATKGDVSALSAYMPGGTIIDLRTPGQVKDDPDPTIPGTTRVWIPIDGSTDYTDFVNHAAERRGFKRAIETIAAAPARVLVHCSAGKDRTGWTVAMVMYVLGATDQQVMTEYMTSRTFGAEVKREWMIDGLAQVRAKYGSIDGYLRQGLGLTDATLAGLRAKLQLTSTSVVPAA